MHRQLAVIAENTFQYTPYTGSPSSSNTLMALSTQPSVCCINVRQNPFFFWWLQCLLIPTSGTPLDPFILPMVRVDRGAIRFLLAGAHMMCPGLTSAGGYLPPADAALPAGAPVAIHAEGKEHAVGIGITKLSSDDMRKINKGIGVETVTYLGDDLWAIQKL